MNLTEELHQIAFWTGVGVYAGILFALLVYGAVRISLYQDKVRANRRKAVHRLMAKVHVEEWEELMQEAADACRARDLSKTAEVLELMKQVHGKKKV